MSLTTLAALFGTMLILAFVPSVSVLAVSSRSAAFGFRHGVFTTFGIVLGDIIFILIAIVGVTVLAETMGPLFSIIKSVGGVYPIWLGILLWRSTTTAKTTQSSPDSSLVSSFMTGLLITLGDQKAIFFYLGFFPAFINLSSISYTQTAIVILTATISILIAKLFYAYMADRASLLVNPQRQRLFNRLASSIMLGVGLFILVKA